MSERFANANETEGALVLREALRRLVKHLGAAASSDPEEQQAALDDFHAAKMLVGQTDGAWDDAAAERGMKRIRGWALGSEPDMSSSASLEARALSDLRREYHTYQIEPDDLAERWRARWDRLEAAAERAGTPFARGYLRGLCDAYRCADVATAWIAGASGLEPRVTTHAVLRFIVEAWKRRAAKFESHTWDTLDGAAQRGKALGLREAIANIEEFIAPAAPEPASPGPFGDVASSAGESHAGDA